MAEDSKNAAEGAAQMARPLLAYRCPAGFDTAEELCRAFRTLLGEAAPGHALRRLGEEEAMPALRDSDLYVALAAERHGAQSLTARIEWREGTDTETVTGPEISLDSSDTALRPSMYPGFLRELWSLSAPPALGDPAE